jgi:hypothetical protein
MSDLNADLAFVRDLLIKLNGMEAEGELPYQALDLFNALMSRMSEQFAKSQNLPDMFRDVVATLGTPIG